MSALAQEIGDLVLSGEVLRLGRVFAEGMQEAEGPNRDQLATMAMQGLLASPVGGVGPHMKLEYPVAIARTAYDIADAMLDERRRRRE